MRWVKGALVPLSILVFWEIASQAGWLPADTFSRPTHIGVAAADILSNGSLATATFQTLEAAAAGLGIALLLGTPVGMLMSLSALATITVSPTLEALRPIPPVALIPLSLLIFGFGISMEAAVIAFACVWPIVIATTAAVRSIDDRLSEVARTLELNTPAYLLKIVLPAAFARIAVGVHVAIGIALVVAVTVEIVVNPRGLGYGMIIAQQSLRPDLMYAQLLWVGCVGWAINALLTHLDRRYLARFSAGGRRQ